MRRILYLGLGGVYSLLPLERLLAAPERAAVVGVLVPGEMGDPGVQQLQPAPASPAELPLLTSPVQPSIIDLAWRHDIPVYALSRPESPAALALLEARQPDLVCVACWPGRLPRPWLTGPRDGALNLHPSLLPAYRGPEPLFWQFRAGEQATGVTVHRMTEALDAGDIVAQARSPLPDGIRGVEADGQLAGVAADLLVDLLARPVWAPRPQPAVGASYQPRPGVADRRFSVDWPARRAFNFVRGADAWAPFALEAGEARFAVADALAWAPNARLGRRAGRSAGPTYRRQGRVLDVQFVDGVVQFRLAD